MTATKQQTPTCWVKAIHPGLLGDTYVSQRLRKILVPEVQTPMVPVSLEMKTNQGQMLLLNVLSHFAKDTVLDCKKNGHNFLPFSVSNLNWVHSPEGTKANLLAPD